MTATRAIVTIASALIFEAAVWATPARAAAAELTLGSEPSVTLSSFDFDIGAPAFTAIARLDASTAAWVSDAVTGRVFETAEVVLTSFQTVRTFDFSDVVVAASSPEDTETNRPMIVAVFSYRTVSETVAPIPETSTWVMLLLGGGGVAFGAHCASRRRRPCPA